MVQCKLIEESKEKHGKKVKLSGDWQGQCMQMEIPVDAELVVVLGISPSHSTWHNNDVYVEYLPC